MIQLFKFLSWAEDGALLLHWRRTVILRIGLVGLLVMRLVRLLMVRRMTVPAVVIVCILLLRHPLLILVVLIVVLHILGLLVGLVGLVRLVPIILLHLHLWLQVLLLEKLLLGSHLLSHLRCLIGIQKWLAQLLLCFVQYKGSRFTLSLLTQTLSLSKSV